MVLPSVEVANQIQSSDTATRLRAVYQMVGMNWIPPDCLAPLVKQLSDPNEELRLYSAKALMYTNPDAKSYLPTINEAYNKETNSEIREVLADVIDRLQSFP